MQILPSSEVDRILFKSILLQTVIFEIYGNINSLNSINSYWQGHVTKNEFLIVLQREKEKKSV